VEEGAVGWENWGEDNSRKGLEVSSRKGEVVCRESKGWFGRGFEVAGCEGLG
jgi:hypothetical protein